MVNVIWSIRTVLVIALLPCASSAFLIGQFEGRTLSTTFTQAKAQCSVSSNSRSIDRMSSIKGINIGKSKYYSLSNQKPCQIHTLMQLRGSTLDDDQQSGKEPQKWRKLNPISVFAKMYSRLIKKQTNFMLKFKSLSKKAKLIVCMQLMAFMIMLGYGGNKIVQNVRGDATVGSVSVARARPVEVSYSVFMDMVEKSGKGHSPGQNPAIKVNDIIIGRDRVHFRLNQDDVKHQEALSNNPKLVQKDDISVKAIIPRSVYAMKVDASPELVKFLRDNKISFKAASKSKSDLLSVMARSSILVIYMLFLLRMYKTMSGGGSSGDIPGKLARQRLSKDGEQSSIQFKDIEGIDDAKFEVMELVDSLRNPAKYSILGARAPRGLLLEGPPGTGKTMLARACAGAAAVPLLYCSGSDFVEMFVGRGAARVRKTFERAGKLAPCIIFIDELDALGKSRSGEMMGMQMRSNDEAEQTLNQLLACMDGLDTKKGICVLAATNRREVLDPALIRPGRFDRIIKVKLPDVKGRERILRVHAQKLPGFQECQGIDDSRIGSLGKGNAVDLSAVAAVTSGLSGAELEFIVNEAAIRAVRRVSAALREGKDPSEIKSPNVNAADFELSVKSFYDTRKTSKGVGDVLSSVLRPKVT